MHSLLVVTEYLIMSFFKMLTTINIQIWTLISPLKGRTLLRLNQLFTIYQGVHITYFKSMTFRAFVILKNTHFKFFIQKQPLPQVPHIISKHYQFLPKIIKFINEIRFMAGLFFKIRRLILRI